jgi:serine/threonine-protein kinase
MTNAPSSPAATVGPSAPSLGEELARLRQEQQRRWAGGDRVPAEELLRGCPGLLAQPEAALELIYGEYLMLEEAGQAPALEEFQRRFPPFAERLRLQLELHHALARGTGRPEALATGAGDTDAFPAQPTAPGGGALPLLPGYRLLRELGRGGMGVVYLAYQQGAGRHVALKMIRTGEQAGPEALARFRAEIAAAARLNHEHIVAVYDVGEADGRPYFTMELVEGGSLDRAVAGKPQPARPAAALVEALARAVQHAHERGVVHRDLKPSNVLLQTPEVRARSVSEGNATLAHASGSDSARNPFVPKIADFGLAKLLDGQGGRTHTQAVLGTPCYMAPEQAGGRTKQVGPAADIYALGAILYECLTGRPPFLGDGVDDILSQVRTAEPTPVRRLQPRAPRDLETICLKCLEKDPRRRYRSAAALADDLRRWLDGRPILARPTTAPERLLKWARRHPALAALWGVSFAAALAAAGLWTWLAQSEAQRRAAASRLAAHNYEEAMQHARAQSDVSDDDLAELVAAVSAARHAEATLDGVPGVDEQRAQITRLLAELLPELQSRRLLAQLEKVPRETRLHPTGFGWDSEHADQQYCRIFQDFGLDLDGPSAEQAAAALCARPGAERLAAALDHWADVLRGVRGPDAAARRRRRLAVARLVDADAMRGALRRALADDDAAALKRLAGEAAAADLPPPTAALLADALARCGDPADAVAVLERAWKSQPGDFLVNYQLGVYLRAAGGDARGRAVGFLRAATALRPGNAGAWLELGNAQLEQGQLAEAVDSYRAAVRLKPGYAQGHSNLGNALRLRGDLKAAAEHCLKAIELEPAYPLAYQNLAVVLLAGGDRDGAVRLAGEALKRLPTLAAAHNTLGAARLEQRRFAEAAEEFGEAVRLQPDFAEAQRNLGVALKKAGRAAEALDALRAAVRLEPRSAEAHHSLGRLLNELKRPDEAAAELREAVRLDPDHALAQSLLAGLLCYQRDADGALRACAEALRVRPDLAEAHYNRAFALMQKQRGDEAIEAAQKAVRLRPDLAEAHNLLGLLLWQFRGDRAAAVACFREAVKRDPRLADAWANLGHALREGGDPDGALAAYRSAVGVNPDFADAQLHLGFLLCDYRQDYAGAAAACREALRVQPSNAWAHNCLGYSLYRLGRRSQAVVSLRRAVALRPDLALPHLNLGHALRDGGDPDGALAEFREAARLDRDNADALYCLGALLAGHKRDYAAAVDAYRASLRLEPRRPEAHNDLGFALVQAGRRDEALAEFRRAVQLRPDYADALCNLGVLLAQEKKDPEEALDACRRAVRLRPWAAAGYHALGSALLAQGKPDEAAAFFRAALYLQPSHAAARAGLAAALRAD